jgi:hypothetical protein
MSYMTFVTWEITWKKGVRMASLKKHAKGYSGSNEVDKDDVGYCMDTFFNKGEFPTEFNRIEEDAVGDVLRFFASFIESADVWGDGEDKDDRWVYELRGGKVKFKSSFTVYGDFDKAFFEMYEKEMPDALTRDIKKWLARKQVLEEV